jgi:hypothetical protein
MVNMQILSINLSRDLSDEITCELGEVVCHVASVDEAYELISDEDFTVIVSTIGEERGLYPADLARLLGITPVSTRILLLGESDQFPELDHWQDQGIEFLGNSSQSELIELIEANSPKFARRM